ncbi:hypothetical protein [Chitinimonas naiadis]
MAKWDIAEYAKRGAAIDEMLTATMRLLASSDIAPSAVVEYKLVDGDTGLTALIHHVPVRTSLSHVHNVRENGDIELLGRIAFLTGQEENPSLLHQVFVTGNGDIKVGTEWLRYPDPSHRPTIKRNLSLILANEILEGLSQTEIE